MAWIQLHQSLITHRKIMKLKKLLNIRTPMAVGYLCLLWLWSLDNAQDGDLSTLTPSELSVICDYRGKDPKNLVRALQDAGFLNSDMSIHDWFDYSGKLIISRKCKQNRDRQYYLRKKKEIDIPTADSLPIEEKTIEKKTVVEKSTVDKTREEEIKKDNITDISNDELKRVCNFYSSYVHQKITNTEVVSLKKLLEDFYPTDIENVIFKFGDRAHSVAYIEKILRNGDYQDRKRSTFDINELDRIIKSL